MCLDLVCSDCMMTNRQLRLDEVVLDSTLRGVYEGAECISLGGPDSYLPNMLTSGSLEKWAVQGIAPTKGATLRTASKGLRTWIKGYSRVEVTPTTGHIPHLCLLETWLSSLGKSQSFCIGYNFGFLRISLSGKQNGRKELVK